ncbi:AAA family ATPase [uncultured Clostridium sp.]|uniref:AAA family ATPase n=1 Tax=uncultured Clostridium sp. TaxID=59620 RepID=UPI0026216A08|nr:AAA family ATPase [uncultured Clostridium sp.]
MIIWLNGPFGVGKTQTASELNKRIEKSFIYDPENMGDFIQKNIPLKIKKDDFQDYKIWREFNYSYIKFLYENYSGTVIVPMTLVNYEYYNNIITELRKNGVKVKMITLIASKETIINRLNNRGDDKDSWPVNQINRCLKGLEENEFEDYINTDKLTINEVVDRILEKI